MGGEAETGLSDVFLPVGFRAFFLDTAAFFLDGSGRFMARQYVNIAQQSTGQDESMVNSAHRARYGMLMFLEI
jgi:hypothetical protein